MKNAKERARAAQIQALGLHRPVSRDATMTEILRYIDTLPPEQIQQIKTYLNREY